MPASPAILKDVTQFEAFSVSSPSVNQDEGGKGKDVTSKGNQNNESCRAGFGQIKGTPFLKKLNSSHLRSKMLKKMVEELRTAIYIYIFVFLSHLEEPLAGSW